MKRCTIIMAIGLLVGCAGFVGAGCKKKGPEQDIAYAQSAEGTHERIQELRGILNDALEKKNLELIHDDMYYLEGLCRALSSRLDGEKKEQVDAILKDLTKIADEIDNSAGRGNQAATEANLQKLMEKLKTLEDQFPPAKKK
jgi:hypothetical protein